MINYSKLTDTELQEIKALLESKCYPTIYRTLRAKADFYGCEACIDPYSAMVKELKQYFTTNKIEKSNDDEQIEQPTKPKRKAKLDSEVIQRTDE